MTQTFVQTVSEYPTTETATLTDTMSERYSSSKSFPSRTASFTPQPSMTKTLTLTDNNHEQRPSLSGTSSLSREHTETLTSSPTSEKTVSGSYNHRGVVSVTVLLTISKRRSDGHSRSLTPERPTKSASASEFSTKTKTITPAPTPSRSSSLSFQLSASRSSSDVHTATRLSLSASNSVTISFTQSVQLTPSNGTMSLTMSYTETNTTTPPPTPTSTLSFSRHNVTFTGTESLTQDVGSKSVTDSSDMTVSSTRTKTELVSGSYSSMGTHSESHSKVDVTRTKTQSTTVSIQVLPRLVAPSDHTMRLSGTGWNSTMIVSQRADLVALVTDDLMRILHVNKSQVEIYGFAIGSLLVFYRISPTDAAYISPDVINALVQNGAFTNTTMFYRSFGLTDPIVVLNTTSSAAFVVPNQACGNTCVIAIVAVVTPILCALIAWAVIVWWRGWSAKRARKSLHKRKEYRYRLRHGGSQPPHWYDSDPYADGHGPVGWAGDVSSDTPTPPDSPFRPRDDDLGFGDANSRTQSDYDYDEVVPDDAASYEFEGRVGYDAVTTPLMGRGGNNNRRGFLEEGESEVGGGEVMDGEGGEDDETAAVEGAGEKYLDDDYLYQEEAHNHHHNGHDDGEGFGSLPNDSVGQSLNASPPWLTTPLRVPWYRPSAGRSASSEAAPPAAMISGDGGETKREVTSPLTVGALGELDRQQTPPRTPGFTPRQHRKAVQRNRRLELFAAAPPDPSQPLVAGGGADVIATDDAELERYLHEDFPEPAFSGYGDDDVNDDDEYEYEYVYLDDERRQLSQKTLVQVPSAKTVNAPQILRAPPALLPNTAANQPSAQLPFRVPAAPNQQPVVPPPAVVAAPVPTHAGSGNGASLRRPPATAARRVNSAGPLSIGTTIERPTSPTTAPPGGAAVAPLPFEQHAQSRLTPDVLPKGPGGFNFAEWEQTIEFPRELPPPLISTDNHHHLLTPSTAVVYVAEDTNSLQQSPQVSHRQGAAAAQQQSSSPSPRKLQQSADLIATTSPSVTAISLTPREKRQKRREEANLVARGLPDTDDLPHNTLSSRRLREDADAMAVFTVASDDGHNSRGRDDSAHRVHNFGGWAVSPSGGGPVSPDSADGHAIVSIAPTESPEQYGSIVPPSAWRRGITTATHRNEDDDFDSSMVGFVRRDKSEDMPPPLPPTPPQQQLPTNTASMTVFSKGAGAVVSRSTMVAALGAPPPPPPSSKPVLPSAAVPVAAAAPAIVQPSTQKRMSLTEKIGSLFSSKSSKQKQQSTTAATEVPPPQNKQLVVAPPGAATAVVSPTLTPVMSARSQPAPLDFLTVRVPLPKSQSVVSPPPTASPVSTARGSVPPSPPPVKSLPPMPSPSQPSFKLDPKPRQTEQHHSSVILPMIPFIPETVSVDGSSVQNSSITSATANSSLVEPTPGLFSPFLGPIGVPSSAARPSRSSEHARSREVRVLDDDAPLPRRSSSIHSNSSAGSSAGSTDSRRKKKAKRRNRRERPPVYEDDLVAIVTVDNGKNRSNETSPRHHDGDGGDSFPSNAVASPPPVLVKKSSVRFKTPSDDDA